MRFILFFFRSFSCSKMYGKENPALFLINMSNVFYGYARILMLCFCLFQNEK